MVCLRCRTSLAATDRACPSCGQPVPVEAGATRQLGREQAEQPGRCGKCGGRMEAGFMANPDEAYWRDAGVWVSGMPERGIFRGLDVEGRSIYTITGKRCAQCGVIELYAVVQIK